MAFINICRNTLLTRVTTEQLWGYKAECMLHDAAVSYRMILGTYVHDCLTGKMVFTANITHGDLTVENLFLQTV